MELVTINSLSEMQELANQVLARLSDRKSNSAKNGASVLVLTGDLGAGKTTFMQYLAGSLKVQEKVQSPTFIIMRRYQTDHPIFLELVHMDAYRIETQDELRPIRLTDILNESKTLFCVEWGEKIIDSLPEQTPQLIIKHRGNTDTRTVEFVNF